MIQFAGFILVVGVILCVIAAKTPVASTADADAALSRKRAAAVTLAAVIVGAITGTIGAGLVLWAALTGWCSDYSTESQCSTQQNQATVTSIVVLCIGIPVFIGLVGITIRGAGGIRVRNLGWLRACGFVAALAAAAATLGTTADRVSYHVGVAVFGVALAVALAGWAALLRWTANRHHRVES